MCTTRRTPARCTHWSYSTEEKARAREQDPRRQEALQAARAMMADIFDGPPEFTDLTVADEWTG